MLDEVDVSEYPSQTISTDRFWLVASVTTRMYLKLRAKPG